MAKRPKKKIKKELKGLGRALVDPRTEEASLVALLRRFSIYTWESPVNVQHREAIINGVRIRCINEHAIDVAGRSGTDQNGRMTWKLSDFICKSDNRRFQEPISFLATPHAKAPVYVTVHVSQPILPQPPDDVVVRVFSWNSNGEPAPSIPFSWRCRALTFSIPE